MAEDEVFIRESSSAACGEEPTPEMTSGTAEVPGGDAVGEAAEDGDQFVHNVSIPLVIFPIIAIVGIAALGALAGPAWASAGAALSVTAFGMWVARVSRSLATALVTGVIGVLTAAGAVVLYSGTQLNSGAGTQAPSKSDRRALLGGVDFSGADLRRMDFSGADLRAANFSGACVMASDFRGADLRDAIFTDADVSGSFVDGTKQTSEARNWPTAPPATSPCRD